MQEILAYFTDSNCWLFFFSTELPDGNTSFARTNTEGENITLPCRDDVQSKQKFLCKDECKTEEDIIIETDGNRAQSGRYNIEYREGSLFGLYVIISNASKSDTGWYKCGYGRALSPDSSYRVPVLVIGGEFLLKLWRLSHSQAGLGQGSTPKTNYCIKEMKTKAHAHFTTLWYIILFNFNKPTSFINIYTNMIFNSAMFCVHLLDWNC